MPKTTIRTVLNNVTHHNGEYTYTQDLVWSKWVAETNTQPSPFVEIIQTHLSDDLDRCDGTGQIECTSDKPRDKESI